MPEPLARRLAVLVGGALGTALRAAVVLAVPVAPGGFPWATLAVNVTGAAALGAVAGAWHGGRDAAVPLALVATGLLGSYTTFSAFALEVRLLLPAAPAVAVLYGLGSVVAGVLAAAAGARVGARAGASRA